MTGELDLGGHRVLVVEDEYYIATDTAEVLRGAGAEVIGPYPGEDAALAELDGRRPDAVVVDINLGPGPSFRLARTLKDQAIPFIFVTGYDQSVIPDEFGGVERLEKPVQLKQIIRAIAKLLADTAEAT
ncbi:MAG: response regulator [Mesorhizobium sp.]|uniref:response regulator n=1 Tax=unclassified Mesorhizobium TaxID=325217 RepID=UPI000F74E4E8|nr:MULTISPECIES: response regulator [unclassified Mesorhizobium]AZO56385.1 response regulator [Mesorhizobium sp. M8A.F.Ca.ET.057.01.1.1]RWE42716.1 MAG: response regulator [Mesorhizobium sp.]RWE48723.1 MAG: response regulator [Mesorhizobium sp.]TJX57606.1 MAG: response regulator [Mesorhizobium sp.]